MKYVVVRRVISQFQIYGVYPNKTQAETIKDSLNNDLRGSKNLHWQVRSIHETNVKENRRNQKLGVLVHRPVKKHSANPKGMVKIYDKITRIEGQKGPGSAFAGERFFHNFSRPYPEMWGSADRKTLVIRKK